MAQESTRSFRPGDHVYVNGREVVVVRRVGSRRPAYRVRSLPTRRNQQIEEWVVDGPYVSGVPGRRGRK
ncbi:MAG: hypothetical protein CMJ18_19375 [Phycisphaeraceae bacterium]|nr:hypothetical protein [Phycisphaeraceae bacterium]